MDKQLIASLKTVLGTAFSLYFKFHAAHWNVSGPFFSQYHAFFAAIYEDIWRSLDDIAEQIRQLDAYTPCSPERLTALSRITSDHHVLPSADMMTMLLRDNDVLIATLTEAFHVADQADHQGLANFLAERIAAHTKWRWQLRATAKQ